MPLLCPLGSVADPGVLVGSESVVSIKCWIKFEKKGEGVILLSVCGIFSEGWVLAVESS